MATSGSYEVEVELKGSAEKHFRLWRSENHRFPEVIGHHIQTVALHEGDWHSHGAVKIWNYTLEGKKEMYKEKREIDDEKMAVTGIGLEGHMMEELKVCKIIIQFYPNPKAKDGCFGKISMIWEKRRDDVPEPIRFFKLVKQMILETDDHLLKA